MWEKYKAILLFITICKDQFIDVFYFFDIYKNSSFKDIFFIKTINYFKSIIVPAKTNFTDN